MICYKLIFYRSDTAAAEPKKIKIRHTKKSAQIKSLRERYVPNMKASATASAKARSAKIATSSVAYPRVEARGHNRKSKIPKPQEVGLMKSPRSIRSTDSIKGSKIPLPSAKQRLPSSSQAIQRRPSASRSPQSQPPLHGNKFTSCRTQSVATTMRNVSVMDGNVEWDAAFLKRSKSLSPKRQHARDVSLVYEINRKRPCSGRSSPNGFTAPDSTRSPAERKSNREHAPARERSHSSIVSGFRNTPLTPGSAPSTKYSPSGRYACSSNKASRSQIDERNSLSALSGKGDVHSPRISRDKGINSNLTSSDPVKLSLGSAFSSITSLDGDVHCGTVTAGQSRSTNTKLCKAAKEIHYSNKSPGRDCRSEGSKCDVSEPRHTIKRASSSSASTRSTRPGRLKSVRKNSKSQKSDDRPGSVGNDTSTARSPLSSYSQADSRCSSVTSPRSASSKSRPPTAESEFSTDVPLQNHSSSATSLPRKSGPEALGRHSMTHTGKSESPSDCRARNNSSSADSLSRISRSGSGRSKSGHPRTESTSPTYSPRQAIRSSKISLQGSKSRTVSAGSQGSRTSSAKSNSSLESKSAHTMPFDCGGERKIKSAMSSGRNSAIGSAKKSKRY